MCFYYITKMKILMQIKNVIMAIAILTIVLADQESDEDLTMLIVIPPSLNVGNHSNLRIGKMFDYHAEREDIKKKKLIRSQHKKKMKEVSDFMVDHLMSTNYFYDEMKRIQKTRVIRNNLRLMVDYLDKPGNSQMKRKVFRCFNKLYNISRIQAYDVFTHPPNNLVKHIIKDPFNDGVIN